MSQTYSINLQCINSIEKNGEIEFRKPSDFKRSLGIYRGLDAGTKMDLQLHNDEKMTIHYCAYSLENVRLNRS